MSKENDFLFFAISRPISGNSLASIIGGRFSYNLDFVTKLIVNVDPTFTLLLTETVPPIYSIIRLQILSPSPVPCEFILECSSSILKFMKSLSKFSSLMPTPWSMTSI